jgi:uncharacterized protein YhjY with autotransporter beta-barrel domain
MLTAAWLIGAKGAAPQSCTQASWSSSNPNPVYDCTLSGGSYTSSVTFTAPHQPPPPGGVVANASQMTATIAPGTVTVPASAITLSNGAPLNITATAATSGDAQGLTIVNSAALTIASGTASGDFAFGLFSQLNGGPGLNGSGSGAGGSGGTSGANLAGNLTTQLVITNTGAITIDNVNVGGSGAALYALTTGGAGGEPGSSSSAGGAGGSATGAVVTNSAPIYVTASGANGYGGIQAIGQGGAGGGASAAKGGGANGGAGGASSVNTSAPVTVNWIWLNATSNYGLYGILAQSAGGNGSFSTESNGGNAGFGGGNPQTASVTITQGANVGVIESNAPTQTSAGIFYGAGVAAQLSGGNGGMVSATSTTGGAGGWAGTAGGVTVATISVTDANITTAGDKLPALLVLAQGGNGGSGDPSSDSHHDVAGGAGGLTGNGVIAVTASAGPLNISTMGTTTSPAVVNLLQGGIGGTGSQFNTTFGARNAGNGGNGGNAGSATVTLTGTPTALITVDTSAKTSPAIYAASIAGSAGDGGILTSTVGGGAGGSGGTAGTASSVDVALYATVLRTQGANSAGIVALSQGGTGGTGGTAESTVPLGAPGGAGGESGTVTVTVDSNSAITTSGQGSSGIVAQSVSGAGGNAGGSRGVIAPAGGNGGSGGPASPVNVDNNGQITTIGAAARGILAQAVSGGGGSGGSSFGVIFSGAGTGGSTGSIGAITINNVGSISTFGAHAQGILAQSLAGGGGAGGDSVGVAVNVGGSASSNPLDADAGSVAVTGSPGSRISTAGPLSIGILGQSIGGGGGDGGSAKGAAISIGGQGGAGGAGGNLAATLTGTTVSTLGDNSHGIVMQSIGGGGGNAGNASGIGIPYSVAIGGSGGSGGNAGVAVVNLDSTSIVTQGSKAAGLVAQSIGGGGGAGGQAFTGSIGAGLSASVGVGGSGGSGGDGGQVSSQLTGGLIASGQDRLLLGASSSSSCPSLPCNLLPVDTYGAVIQSIGGGGGIGGSATARALAIAVPVTPTGSQVGLGVAVAIGGSGGTGGNANYVSFAVTQGGTITTSGQGGTAVLLQSIGGGGGAGGDSSAMSAVLGYGSGTTPGASSLGGEVQVSLGGQGGSGGNGGAVYMALGGTVSVSGNTPTFTPDPVGAAGSTITTYGDFAAGIKAQSIGGGGGDAGHGGGNTQNFGTGYNITVGINLGATGGQGGNGGPVAIEVFPISTASTSTVLTWGSGANGVLAQSIGGGGGTSSGGSYSFGGTKDQEKDGSIVANVNVALGLQGATGGLGGNVNVDVKAPITTHGGDAAAVLAQSIGGGGGVGGSAGSDASADNPIIAGLNVRSATSNIRNGSAAWVATFSDSVGGRGGLGNDGGTVNVNLNSALTTFGDWADAIVAQSIGGGGGKGGTAAATGTGGRPDITININNAVGGSGGIGGAGGPVTVGLGGSTINTGGFGATGVFAQSVGGGGGIAADGSDGAWGYLAVGGASSGSGGAAGVGGNVTVNTNAGSLNSITTKGEAAEGLVLQSVGGGGGLSGAGSSIQFAPARHDLAPTTVQAGGQQGSSGNGGTVTFTDGGNIQIGTIGNNAFGMVAQSIGGGGGIVKLSQYITSQAGLVTQMGGNAAPLSPSAGGAVNVTLNAGSSITTSGTGAHGIVAQSIGGGGGIVGLPGSAPTLTVAPQSFPQSGYGNGGVVTVSNDARITVSGVGAIGILAQSIGGGGGLITLNDGSTVFAGSAAPSASTQGSGSLVTVLTTGKVTASGANGVGIFAQSTGTGGGEVSVSVAAPVMGGSGQGSAIMIDSVPGSLSNVSIGSGGSVSAQSGTAITATGGPVNVTNFGTITGQLSLNGGKLTNFGTYNPGSALNHDVVNSGQMTHSGTMGNVTITTNSGGVTTLLGGASGGAVRFVTNAGGTLLVNGTLPNSTVSLQNGGTLGGSGTVGGVVSSGGVLAPGNSIGTLTVAGNFSQIGGSYQAEVNDQGASDRVNVTGNATIGGGATVVAIAQPGVYRRSISYTLLNATGGLSGTYSFSGAISNLAFVVPSLSYDANSVSLLLTPSFAAGARNANQSAVAALLDRIGPSATGDLATVLDVLSGLNQQQGPAALVALSGQPVANFGTVNVVGGSLFMNALGQQMGQLHGGSGGGQRLALAEACEIAACEGMASRWSGWMSALGGLGSVAGNGNASALTYNFGGGAVGLDYRFTPSVLAGVSVGYAHGTQWVEGFSGQGTSDSIGVALYGSFTQGGFYADVLAGYAYYANRIQRQIVIPGLAARTASGSTGANQLLGQLETGYQVPLWEPARASITPFARLQASSLWQNGFGESGAQSLNLDVAAQTTQSLATTFGVELAGALPLGSERPLELALRLGWQHEFADTSRPMTAAFSGAPSAGFTVYGATPQRDAVILGFSARTNLAEATQLYLRYDGQLASGFNNHALTAGLRLNW